MHIYMYRYATTAEGGQKLKEEIDYRCKKKEEKKKVFFSYPAFLHRRRGRLLRFPSQLTQRRYIKKQLFNFNGHYFDIHLAIKPKIYFQPKMDIILLLRVYTYRTEPLFLRYFPFLIFLFFFNTCVYNNIFLLGLLPGMSKLCTRLEIQAKTFLPSGGKNYTPACLWPMGNIFRAFGTHSRRGGGQCYWQSVLRYIIILLVFLGFKIVEIP